MTSFDYYSLYILVGAVLTLMYFSYLWKLNPIFNIVAHIAIGASMGHHIVMAVNSIYEISIARIATDMWIVIPTIVGLFLFLRYNRKTFWISTIPIAILIGVGTGLTVSGSVKVSLIGQIMATLTLPFAGTPRTIIENFITIIAIVTTISFFIFEKRISESLPIRMSRRLGYYIIIVGLGSAVGLSVASWIAMSMNLHEPYSLTWPGPYSYPIFAVMMIIMLLYQRYKKPST